MGAILVAPMLEAMQNETEYLKRCINEGTVRCEFRSEDGALGVDEKIGSHLSNWM